MGANFNDKIFVDGGIQQLGVSYIRTYEQSATELLIQTSVPAPSSYVMIMVETTGCVFTEPDTTKPFKGAWNFYSYYYDIGNAQNLGKGGGLTAATIYSTGGYMWLRADLPYGGNLSAVFEIYATAGNGYRYPVSILSYVLNTP